LLRPVVLLTTALGVLVFSAVPVLAAGPPETPVAQEAKPIIATTATLYGELNPAAEGEVEAGHYEFLYRASSTACTGTEGKTAPMPAGVAYGRPKERVSAKLTGLRPGTEYTFCLLARNEAGEASASSAPVTFTTAPQAEPAVEEAYASEVSSSSVTLDARIDPNGAETGYRFEYGTGAGYQPVPGGQGSIVEGTAGVLVSVHIQAGLSPAATYHYRLVATNALSPAGGTTGPDQTFTTQGSATAFTLLDGRQYEMVTPPQKEGALFYPPIYPGLVIQASANGDAIGDMASVPTEAQPQGHAEEESSVLSTRGPGGWSSQVINGPHGDGASTFPGAEGGEIRLFSEDLSHVVAQPQGLTTLLSPEASEATAYLRTNYLNGNVTERCQGSYLTTSSCYQALVTKANTRPGAVFGEAEKSDGECTKIICGPHFVDASPDLHHIVVYSETQLTSTPGAGDYEWSGGRLQLLPGKLAGIETIGAQHAISADGGRVIVEDGGLDLLEVGSGEMVQLDAAELGCATCGTGGGEFENASSDDSRIFFLDGERLTVSSAAVRAASPAESLLDLYECEIVEVAGKHRCSLSDLTPPTLPGGEPADVAAVLGVSRDGSYVYFAAGGALAPGAVPDACHYEAEYGGIDTEGCNVYVRHDGVTRLVAAGWIENGGRFKLERSRVSPDGRWLALMSPRELTGVDNRDAVSGQPDAEVYLYHAETSPSGTLEPGKLTCASCNPTGERPLGLPEEGLGWTASSVPTWLVFATGEDGASGTRYQSRYLSDSGRLFFDSEDALVPQDVNGTQDVYEYEPEGVPAGVNSCSSASTSGSETFRPAHAFAVKGRTGEEDAGCVALISSGTSSEPSSFLDASESGGDVFFLTSSKLAQQDFDTAPDAYDAHECTSASPCTQAPVIPPPCTTEASCKPSPTPQPSIYGLPSSATFSGPGNVVVPPLKPAAPKKVAKRTVKCRKGLVKSKKGKCVKRRKRKQARKSNRRVR
jgi:hypothetical protein